MLSLSLARFPGQKKSSGLAGWQRPKELIIMALSKKHDPFLIEAHGLQTWSYFSQKNVENWRFEILEKKTFFLVPCESIIYVFVQSSVIQVSKFFFPRLSFSIAAFD